MATNILNWIKYQNEGKGLAKENVDLNEIVEQVIAVLGPIAHKKGIQLVNDLGPTRINQFFEPLKILVYNIVSNAINFSEKGTIAIRCESKGDRVILSVQDEGIGMTQDQIENILTGKTIVHRARAGAGKGHGLGYLIIKDLLKMTGGTLHIESVKGKGSKISIQLPGNHKSS